MNALRTLGVILVIGGTAGVASAAGPKPAHPGPKVVSPRKLVAINAARLPKGVKFEKGALTVSGALTFSALAGSGATINGLNASEKVDFWCTCMSTTESSDCSLSISGKSASCGGGACCTLMASPAEGVAAPAVVAP